MKETSGRTRFAKTLKVSRETLARFDCWHDVLCKWSKKINLVAPGTLADFWIRHALDSAQVAVLMPPAAQHWIDLGSGAGFPGLAIALMRMEHGPVHMVLVEANAKKAAFLRVCIQATGAPAKVICARVESLPAQPYDVITARALAPLPRLLELSEPLTGPDTVRLFSKGAHVQKEIADAAEDWTLDIQSIPSLTDRAATILKIRKANRV